MRKAYQVTNSMFMAVRLVRCVVLMNMQEALPAEDVMNAVIRMVFTEQAKKALKVFLTFRAFF